MSPCQTSVKSVLGFKIIAGKGKGDRTGRQTLIRHVNIWETGLTAFSHLPDSCLCYCTALLMPPQQPGRPRASCNQLRRHVGPRSRTARLASKMMQNKNIIS